MNIFVDQKGYQWHTVPI